MATSSEILGKYKSIAVVGLSPNESRPSFGVSQYMQQQGYKIIPVNPGHATILGEKSYKTLDEVSEPLEIVNIFRRSEHIPEIVETAIRKGAKVIWMQLGIENEEAAAKARAAGLDVVMDTCILQEHRRVNRR